MLRALAAPRRLPGAPGSPGGAGYYGGEEAAGGRDFVAANKAEAQLLHRPVKEAPPAVDYTKKPSYGKVPEYLAVGAFTPSHVLLFLPFLPFSRRLSVSVVQVHVV